MKELIGDTVLIKPEENEQKRDSGLYTTVNNDQGDIKSGEVKYIGHGKFHNGVYIETSAYRVNVNDNVLYRYGTELEIDGERFELVNIEDIILVK